MNYSEAAFFDRNACQHVADWLDHKQALRVERIARAQLRYMRLTRR